MATTMDNPLRKLAILIVCSVVFMLDCLQTIGAFDWTPIISISPVHVFELLGATAAFYFISKCLRLILSNIAAPRRTFFYNSSAEACQLRIQQRLEQQEPDNDPDTPFSSGWLYFIAIAVSLLFIISLWQSLSIQHIFGRGRVERPGPGWEQVGITWEPFSKGLPSAQMFPRIRPGITKPIEQGIFVPRPHPLGSKAPRPSTLQKPNPPILSVLANKPSTTRARDPHGYEFIYPEQLRYPSDTDTKTTDTHVRAIFTPSESASAANLRRGCKEGVIYSILSNTNGHCAQKLGS